MGPPLRPALDRYGTLDGGDDMAHIGYVTIDCADVEAQRRWWADALGYEPVDGPWALLRDPEGEGPMLYFQAVSEAKSTKNRLHLDLVAREPATELARLVEAGATRVGDRTEGGIAWTVLRDPEGNEFCLFPADPDQDATVA